MKTTRYHFSRRPPSDTFTRFTSATPHATTFTSHASTSSESRFASAGASPSQPSQPSSSPQSQRPSSSQPPPPPNETPAQRVARLRAAHRAALESQSTSTVDRLLSTSRNLADSAHRITAYGLILFSGVAVCVTAYGTISLMTHSRRQKRAWIERELDRLDDARKAFLQGTASAEQLHLLEQERAGQEMEDGRAREALRKKEAGVWGRMKELVGLKVGEGEMGEESESQRARRLAKRNGGSAIGEEMLSAPAPGTVVKEAVQVSRSEIPGVGIDSKGRPVPAGRVEYVARTVGENPQTGEKEVTVRAGGPLDLMADHAASVVTSSSTSSEGKSWMSWIRGGSKS